MSSFDFEDRAANTLYAWSSGSSEQEDDFDPDEDESEETEKPYKKEVRPN
jgi:hypothetical protein